MSDRAQREKEYHDEFFDHGERRGVEKFYSVFGPSRVFFEGYLRDHCVGRDVLEIGCGTGGGMSFPLARLGARVTATDISDTAVAIARKKAENENLTTIQVMTANAEQMEFPDSSFDIVFGQSIIHHLDLNHVYSEASRILRPSGVAIFEEPLGHNPFINLYRRLTPKLRTPDEQPLRMKDIHLAYNYFNRVDLSFYYLTSLIASPFHKQSWQPKFVTLLNKVDKFLFRILPFCRRYAWFSVIILSEPKK